MSNESLVIYSMNKVGRIVPPDKQILRDILLGFYSQIPPGSNGRVHDALASIVTE